MDIRSALNELAELNAQVRTLRYNIADQVATALGVETNQVRVQQNQIVIQMRSTGFGIRTQAVKQHGKTMFDVAAEYID